MTNLEQAKRLEAAGFPQEKSYAKTIKGVYHPDEKEMMKYLLKNCYWREKRGICGGVHISGECLFNKKGKKVYWNIKQPYWEIIFWIQGKTEADTIEHRDLTEALVQACCRVAEEKQDKKKKKEGL